LLQQLQRRERALFDGSDDPLFRLRKLRMSDPGQKKEDGGSTTFLLSVKHSYLDQTSKSIYGSFGEPFNNGLPYNFTDLYGKVSFNANNGSKLNLFGFNFDDKAKIFFDTLAKEGVHKIVFSSTAAVYGEGRAFLTEDSPTAPINPYGESKLAFERILRWYGQIHGLKFVSLRYFNAAGASARFGEDHRIETHLIPNVLKVALGEKSEVEIYGTDYDTPDGTCIRDYIHILDLARAHILALQSSKSEFYNLGTGGGSSVREVIAAAGKVAGKKIKVVERPRRPGDPPRLIAASDKIKSELGWKPQFQSLETILESAWKWHQKFPRGYGD